MKRGDSGRSLEYRVYHKERRNATTAMLSSGSRGNWDIIAVYPGYTKVIQCKSRGYLQDLEKAKLMRDLVLMPDNLQAELVYRISRKKTKTKVIKAVDSTDWDKVWQNLSYFDKPRGIELKQSPAAKQVSPE